MKPTKIEFQFDNAKLEAINLFLKDKGLVPFAPVMLCPVMISKSNAAELMSFSARSASRFESQFPRTRGPKHCFIL